MLSSLLKTNFIKCKDYGILKDSYNLIREKLLRVQNDCDLIILSGGASKGSKDYLVNIIKELGKLLFSKVSIKPGRPLLLGILKNNLPILVLPGNPVASFVTFNIFGKFLINCMMGNVNSYPRYFKVKANFNMKKKIGREEFIRGRTYIKNNHIYVDKYKTEGAGILNSVVWSTGLIRLDEKKKLIKVNDEVDFMPYENF